MTTDAASAIGLHNNSQCGGRLKLNADGVPATVGTLSHTAKIVRESEFRLSTVKFFQELREARVFLNGIQIGIFDHVAEVTIPEFDRAAECL